MTNEPKEKAPELTPKTVAPPPDKTVASMVPIGDNGIALRSLEDLVRFARMAVSGQVAPKGMSEGAAALAIQAGLERGLGLLGGLQQCVVINNTLSWKGQAAAALIRNSPVCKPGSLKFWPEGEGDNRKGIAVGWRVGYEKPDRCEFTIKNAKQAHLWGKAGSWQQYPERMLMWRALGLLARDVFGDVLGGFPLAEEAEDFERVKVEEKPPITSKPEPPPIAGPDPLLEALSFNASSNVKARSLDDLRGKREPDESPSSEEAASGQTRVIEGAALDGDDVLLPGIPEAVQEVTEDDMAATCQHGIHKSEYCAACSLDADAAIAAKEAEWEALEKDK